jgi:Cellulose binding domain/Glycosyl hydrolase family 26
MYAMKHRRSMGWRQTIGMLAVVGTLLGTVVVNSAGPAGAAGTTKYFGVFREATPTQIAAATTSTYAVTPASVEWFDSWATGNAFPVSEARALWSKGILPHYTWEPWNAGLGVSAAGQIHLQDIINGTWDSYIRARAAEFASVGSPILVRFGHEFNGNWYPWGIANNGNNPALYISAYRHVHDLVKAAGATNVQWVWTFSNSSTPSASWNDPALAYPGAAYVDWVGIDGYNWGYGPSWDPTGNHWLSFSATFASAYQQARSIAPNRPVTIAEVASSEDGGNKAAWINDMSAQLNSGSYPDLKLLTWFDQNKEELWSGTSSAATQVAFTAWVKQAYMAGKGTDLALVAGQYAGTTPTPTATATATASPSPTPTPTPTTGAGRACTATYTVVNKWPGGFQGGISVANSGSTAVSGWKLAWTLPSGQTISQLWNGNLTVSGSAVTVTNASWNGSLATGAATSLGLQGTFTGSSPTIPSLVCTAS